MFNNTPDPKDPEVNEEAASETATATETEAAEGNGK